MLFGDEEAGDGPNRLVIHWFQHARSFQARERRSRRERAPRDWQAVQVRKDSGRFASVHDRFHRAFVRLALLLLKLRTPQPWPHTPTTAARPALSKQGLKILPTVRRQWMEFEFGGLGGHLLGDSSL